jgi:hypothetical protein
LVASLRRFIDVQKDGSDNKNINVDDDVFYEIFDNNSDIFGDECVFVYDII